MGTLSGEVTQPFSFVLSVSVEVYPFTLMHDVITFTDKTSQNKTIYHMTALLLSGIGHYINFDVITHITYQIVTGNNVTMPSMTTGKNEAALYA